eukprot:superscaffoldBa00000875_g7749
MEGDIQPGQTETPIKVSQVQPRCVVSNLDSAVNVGDGGEEASALVGSLGCVVCALESHACCHVERLWFLESTSQAPLLDPLQFAYWAYRSGNDAINMGLQYILQHLNSPGTYTRILFVDFISVFNIIIPETFLAKLTGLTVHASICQWITNFLTDRKQQVRLEEITFGIRTFNSVVVADILAKDEKKMVLFSMACHCDTCDTKWCPAMQCVHTFANS